MLTRSHAARWPAAVGVSVVAHVAIGAALFVVLGRSSSSAPPPAPHPRAVEVMRIGVLSRTAHPPSVVSAPPTRAARGAIAPARPLPLADSVTADVVLPGPEAGRADSPSMGTEALGEPTSTSLEGAVGQPGAAPQGTADVPGETAAALDLAFTRELHARLAAAAADCYPPQARKFRQQARVPLSFCVDGDGQPERVVVTPSGVASLDEAASGCVVRKAAPFSARARSQCFTVSIDFGARGD